MPFSQTTIIDSWPKASRVADAERCLAQLSAHAALAPLLADSAHRALIEAASGNAPYLARLMSKYPSLLATYLANGAEHTWQTLVDSIGKISAPGQDQKHFMRALRELKSHCALTTALADISGHWDLDQVTGALSHLAQEAVAASLRFLLTRAMEKGEFAPKNPSHPEQDSGIIILGMGKLGGYELNYSSDIDLIILFNLGQLPYAGPRNVQHFMVKLANDLVTLLEERTADGYVFRTDLRLRPDPMSTPPAVTTATALSYYETVGQNWERAAMIKARPIAGDIPAGERYLRELIPFLWRKTLDFATIADIHSIKRQMNLKSSDNINLYGHNIKTGLGGIREIEFFVQTQQLVWGGRIPELRARATLDALAQLTEYGQVPHDIRDTLTHRYRRLRTIEHRLQMRQDEQTHHLPKNPEAMREVAMFCGFGKVETFMTSCLHTLQDVHRIYTESMQDSAPLAVDGNLVFTGVEADPDTLETLVRLGYKKGQRISDIIQGWHRGSRRSTRSKRSRQVLTELVPALLTALGKTADPDTAFFHFDGFIDRLPSGAQIFSLFLSRPEMLTLLADILGSAPALGTTLSNNPSLLDSVLDADFFLGLPSKKELENIVIDRLRFAHDFEQKMIYLRSFNNEKRFQAGVHLLKRLASPKRVGAFLSDVAEVILQSTMQEVWAEYAATSGTQLATPFAVLAFGKLGGREMTFGSDIDIVFLYDDEGDSAPDTRTHLIRISQRLISALTLLTREGRLYEVDTRLRPGGSDGPLAVSLAAFSAYFEKSAWTYEHMALTRARVVATNDPAFAARVEAMIRTRILNPRDPALLLKDVLDMRARIAKEFPTKNPWALKHIRGGMVDLDFIAQYLILRHAHTHPDIWHRSARPVFESAQLDGLLPLDVATNLHEAKKFLTDLLSLLRLSAPGGVITDDAPVSLIHLVTAAMRMDNFEALKERVVALETNVKAAFALMEAAQL